MNAEELREGIDVALRSLRSADTQAAAVAWMKKAYLLLEACEKALRDRPPQIVRERLVFVPERPRIEVVQAIPRRMSAGEAWFKTPTVVYPEAPMPPPKPRPWTHRDTVRLEQAVRTPKRHIQRLGK